MMVLDIFALVVMLVLIGVVIWLVVLLGPLPGKIARQRSHPQSDAIMVLGWVGLVTLGIGWFAALIWAFTKPFSDAALRARISELEGEVARLKASGPVSGGGS